MYARCESKTTIIYIFLTELAIRNADIAFARRREPVR